MMNFFAKISIPLLAVAVCFMAPKPLDAGAPVDFPYGAATSNVVHTPHNLGSTGGLINNGTTNTCIFCHTPHTGVSGGGPLWNRTVSTFTAYGTTLGGSFVGDNDLGGITLACLSCHDGVTSLDTLVNAPGKGNGGTNTNQPINFDWVFTIDGNTVSDVLTTVTSVIGTDLTNDHPVSIPYTENIASLRPTSTVISALVMTTEGLSVGAGNDASSATAITNRWSVNGFVSSDATIADLLRGGKVECVSCHDPHFKNTSWDEVDSTWPEPINITGLFLRRVGGNSVSGVCRTCHAK